jgi:phosphoenolpyruvate-protein kinase (PTS system EI component)
MTRPQHAGTSQQGEFFSETELRDTIVTAVRRAADPADPFGVADAILAVDAMMLDRYFHAEIDHQVGAAAPVILATGIGASPGAASGRLVVDPEDAVLAAERGDDVILIRPETLPQDVAGMRAARAVITTRGGVASHAAVVARAWGIPAVVGATEVVVGSDGITIGDRRLTIGTEISVDGRRGEVLLGRIGTAHATAPPELGELLGWADDLRRGAVAVLANADTATDVALALSMGADGVGLCRTEHMFLAPDRLALVRRYILSDDAADERALLATLEAAQYEDFVAILSAARGAPVTIRLLDAPLHEFLPDAATLVAREARGDLGPEECAVLSAIRRLREANPMLGVRGVRLDVVRPGLYAMQARALARAALTVATRGAAVGLEVMIPLVADARELQLARRRVLLVFSELDATRRGISVRVGTMIETPRSAVTAGEFAEHVDFVSFGTNDLTQLVFGFSRDDVEQRLIPTYLERGVFGDNPFARLDTTGVGYLVATAIAALRTADPSIPVSVCGEQAGDPRSIDFLVASGTDSVSCSPYRLPGARLAVAQALLRHGRVRANDATASHDSSRDTSDGAFDTVAAALAEGRVPSPHDEEFAVLHALALRAPVGVDSVAELALVDARVAGEILTGLLERDLVRNVGDLWAPRPAGRVRHTDLLERNRPRSVEQGRGLYRQFQVLDRRVKELCTAWQVRHGETNDHSDPDYDAACVDDLAAIDASIAELLGEFAVEVPRLAAYAIRLGAASRRVRAGEVHMFTAAMCGSFHDVWMELHQDLMLILGLDRAAEADA